MIRFNSEIQKQLIVLRGNMTIFVEIPTDIIKI